MITPTIHMNGTSKKDLLEGYCKIMHALHETLARMQEYSPNARDYYVQSPTAYAAARDQYQRQFKAINEVLQEIEQIVEEIA